MSESRRWPLHEAFGIALLPNLNFAKIDKTERIEENFNHYILISLPF